MAINALENPVFKPAMRIVTYITNSSPALITTSFAHGYQSGLIVRIDIPLGFGMQQINQKVGEIVVITDDTFTINIDTTHFDIFSTPNDYPQNAQLAQVVPIAEDNRLLTQAVRNILPF